MVCFRLKHDMVIISHKSVPRSNGTNGRESLFPVASNFTNDLVTINPLFERPCFISVRSFVPCSFQLLQHFLISFSLLKVAAGGKSWKPWEIAMDQVKFLYSHPD